LVKLQPGHRLYFNQLVLRVGTGSGAVSREVDKLIKLGLVTDEWEGNHRYLHAAHSASVHVELHALLSKCMSEEAAAPPT
jgi:DNA-binding transcriptional ArsR family regulator